jgi:aminopeptidase YwaD
MKVHLLILALISSLSLIGQVPIDNFRSDIEFLSSDSLEGRLTGSVGEKISAEYIASQFEQYGLTHKEGQGFIQTFQTIGRKFIEDGDLSLTKTNEKGEEQVFVPENWYPLSQSSEEVTLDGEFYFAGYGMYVPKLNYSDFPDTLRGRGKTFVIKLGYPKSIDPHSPIMHYSGISNKIKTAKRFGAKAIVFIPSEGHSDVPKRTLNRNIKSMELPILFVDLSEIEFKSYSEIRGSYNIQTEYATGRNVVGYIDNGAAHNIVIGAHHDHLGHGEYGGSRKPDSKEIHNGADDNASGVAMMLQLMRELSHSTSPSFNYVFMAFSGEEMGLIGSKHIVDFAEFDSTNTNCMINFDMVGRLKPDNKTLLINGVGTSAEWDEILAENPIDSTLFKIKTTESGTGASDHTAFYLKGIPVLHFFTGQHYEYHTPEDDAHLINYEGMVSILDYTKRILNIVSGQPKLQYRETKSESDGRVVFKVTLGIMPDYVFEGPGLKIDAVSGDKAADKAGILAGDVVMKMEGVCIQNIYDYTKCLSMFNKGQKITVEIKRDGKLIKLPVVF